MTSRDEPFDGLFTQGMVLHETYRASDGSWLHARGSRAHAGRQGRCALSDKSPVEVGRSEKMSKSKKNVVDPDQIIHDYGADTARWFMLSDSPPERDLEWTEAGVTGAWRFQQRLHRIASEAIGAAAAGRCRQARARSPRLRPTLRRAAHRTIAGVSADIEAFHFNKAVARLYELANTIGGVDAEAMTATQMGAARGAGDLRAPDRPDDAASRRGAVAGARPQDPAGRCAWPVAEDALLVDDTVTVAVQLNGKLRGTVQLRQGRAEGRGGEGGAGAARDRARPRRQDAQAGDRGAQPHRQRRRLGGCLGRASSELFSRGRILVTGATGLFGRELVDRLLALGAHLRTASILPPPADFPAERVEHLTGDLADRAFADQAMKGVTGLFHLAGRRGSVGIQRKHAATMLGENLMICLNTLDAARRAGVERILYTSTVTVYPPMEVYREDLVWSANPHHADEFASWAKRMAEKFLEAQEIQYGVRNSVIVRPVNTFGPHDDFAPETALVVPALIGRALSGKIRSPCGATARRCAISSMSPTPSTGCCSLTRKASARAPSISAAGAAIRSASWSPPC